jgi:hypothetical protein
MRGGERMPKRGAYPDGAFLTRVDVIEIVFRGDNDPMLCQYGTCGGCGLDVSSNAKYVYCPNCGTYVSVT